MAASTYVISPTDPGVANWLAAAGIGEGLGVLRWQAVPNSANLNPTYLTREFRVVKLAELDNMPDLPRITPKQRKAQINARVEGYNTRVL